MSDDRLHQLFDDAIGAEPPVGSPHAAVRRRAARLRRRRQATGAAIGTVGIALAALAPAVIGSLRGRTTEAASPTGDAPLVDQWAAAEPCQVTTEPGTAVFGRPLDVVDIQAYGEGLDARAAHSEAAQVSNGQSIALAAVLDPGDDVRAVSRVVIGLDPVVTTLSRYACELRDTAGDRFPPGRSLRLILEVPGGAVAPGTYKGVVLSKYQTVDGATHAADAELGFYTFN